MKQIVMSSKAWLCAICILSLAQEEIIYIENFLSDSDYASLLQQLGLHQEAFIDEGIRTASIVKDPLIHAMFYNEDLMNKLSDTIGIKVADSDFPIEYRFYKAGRGMAWHFDTQLYSEPQYEAVYTIENSTNSCTEWLASSKYHSLHTRPNSMLLVRADGPIHRTSAFEGGTRRILKIVYPVGLMKIDQYHVEKRRFT